MPDQRSITPVRGPWRINVDPVCGRRIPDGGSYCDVDGQPHHCPDRARGVEVVPVAEVERLREATHRLLDANLYGTGDEIEVATVALAEAAGWPSECALRADLAWYKEHYEARAAYAAGLREAGDELADAVSDIMGDDPESVLHTWVQRWRNA